MGASPCLASHRQKWFAADFKELTITIEKENRA
jgi:hypothetical protein